MNKKIFLIIPIAAIIVVAGLLIFQLNNTPQKRSDSNDDDVSNLLIVLKGDRLFGIDVNEADDGEYDEAFDIAKSTGIDFITLSLGWDDIETSPYNYTCDYLTIANWYYPDFKNFYNVALTIAPIDTNVDRRPTDLKGKALNDTEVISRFKNMLYNVSTQLNNVTLLSFSIGNEVNSYLGADPEAWANYTDFFNQTSNYARELWGPNLKIGCKTMFYALVGEYKEEIQKLNNYSDVIMTTYYPLNEDFSVKPISVIKKDFDNITLTYDNKDIYFLEAGYPSNYTLGSSNSTQAAFIEEIFKQWDSHADRIKLINIHLLHDRTSASVQAYCDYYGLFSENFKAYLGSLGMRTSNGKDKEAFLKLKNMAQVRGW